MWLFGVRVDVVVWGTCRCGCLGTCGALLCLVMIRAADVAEMAKMHGHAFSPSIPPAFFHLPYPSSLTLTLRIPLLSPLPSYSPCPCLPQGDKANSELVTQLLGAIQLYFSSPVSEVCVCACVCVHVCAYVYVCMCVCVCVGGDADE